MEADHFAFRDACIAAEYQGCFCKIAKVSRESTTVVPAALDVLKFNVDEAHTPGNQHRAWGVVVRDNAGTVVAARAGELNM